MIGGRWDGRNPGFEASDSDISPFDQKGSILERGRKQISWRREAPQKIDLMCSWAVRLQLGHQPARRQGWGSSIGRQLGGLTWGKKTSGGHYLVTSSRLVICQRGRSLPWTIPWQTRYTLPAALIWGHKVWLEQARPSTPSWFCHRFFRVGGFGVGNPSSRRAIALPRLRLIKRCGNVEK